MTLTPLTIVQIVLFVIVIPLLPLLISARWDWREAWAYAFIAILGFSTSRILAYRRHPDLLAERARMTRHQDTVSWDRLLAPLVGLGGGLIPLVAGLDARFDWSPAVAPLLRVAALVVIAAGYLLGSYALITNRFFSGVVRIQVDRKHHVVSNGPYRWVRHPGYAGALLTYLATPVLLEALWAFLPVAFISVTLVVRTRLEDRTLQQKLPGYEDYARTVPYRLLPGVW
jgi:protein-S-isoprenylcysteine O-methyltransferase Ste14